MNKLYVYAFLIILIVLVGWQYTRQATKIGELKKENATLVQSVEDGEKERDKLKQIAELNSATIAAVSKEKNILNNYALKKAHELEILKYENAEIKKWSGNVVPYVLSGKLYGITDNDNANGLYLAADGSINANAGTEIEVQNEALYNYTNDLTAALGSCNADKTGLYNWYIMAGIILE